MDRTLSGRAILVVEDEGLLALDISSAFQSADAQGAVARSVSEALAFVERSRISAAIVDFGLGDDDAKELCARLSRKGEPFLLHSGHPLPGLGCEAAAVIPKPASADRLANAAD